MIYIPRLRFFVTFFSILFFEVASFFVKLFNL